MSNIYGDIAGDIALTVKPDFRELYKADAVAKKLAAEQKKQAEEGKQKRLDAATKRLLEYSKMPDESKLHRDVRPEVQQKYAEFMKAALQSVITSDPTDVEKAFNLADKFEKDLASVYLPASAVGFAADKQLQERGVLASEKEFQGLGKGWRNWNFDPEMTGFRVDPSQNLYQIGNVSRVQELGKTYRDVAKANEGSFTEKGVAINLPFGNRLVPLSPKTAAKLDAFQGAVLQNPEAQTYFLRSALQNGLISRGTFNAFQKNPAALIDSLSIDDTKGAVIGNPASIESKEFARAVNKFLEDNPVSETVRVSPQSTGNANFYPILEQGGTTGSIRVKSSLTGTSKSPAFEDDIVFTRYQPLDLTSGVKENFKSSPGNYYILNSSYNPSNKNFYRQESIKPAPSEAALLVTFTPKTSKTVNVKGNDVRFVPGMPLLESVKKHFKKDEIEEQSFLYLKEEGGQGRELIRLANKDDLETLTKSQLPKGRGNISFGAGEFE